MQPAASSPRVHLFVCSNRRASDSPLGPGCGDHGERVYAALKREVAREGRTVDVWVTRTLCLGICPRHGSTVAVYPKPSIWRDVTESDAGALFALVTGGSGETHGGAQ